MSMNHGKVISVAAAGQVGMFRREVGRWPKDRADLIAHGCLRLDHATGSEPPDEPGCQFFITLPYQLELQSRAENLQMVIRDPSGKLICQLVVVAPRGAKDSLNPLVVLKTTLFSCPGEGKPLS
jgi:hypothetical protein